MELTQFELGVLFERLGLGKEEIDLVFESRDNIEYVLESLLEKHRLYTGIIKKEEPKEIEEEPIVPEVVKYVPSREVRELEQIAANTEDPEVKQTMKQTIEAAKEREKVDLDALIESSEKFIPEELNEPEDMDKTMDERLDSLLGMTKPVGDGDKGSEANLTKKSNKLDGWISSGSDKKLNPVNSVDEAKPTETIDTGVSAEDIFGKWGDGLDEFKAPAPLVDKSATNPAPNVVNNDVFFSNPWEVRK